MLILPLLFVIVNQKNILYIEVVIKHKIMPVNIGNSIEYNTHLILPVSFLIVRQVVEHGK